MLVQRIAEAASLEARDIIAGALVVVDGERVPREALHQMLPLPRADDTSVWLVPRGQCVWSGVG